MTMTPGPATRTSLNAQVAAEVRAEMGRRGMSNAELARLLGVSEAWTTRRLGKRADTVLNLADMQRIAAALGVPLTTFFTPEIRDEVPQPLTTHGYATVPVQSPPTDRPKDNRPIGRPGATATIGVARTAYLTRPGRRRRDR